MLDDKNLFSRRFDLKHATTAKVCFVPFMAHFWSNFLRKSLSALTDETVMARMHSRKRGKHGSKKPAKKNVPSWILYDAKKTELLIAKLGKEGKSPSQIGLMLRDTYGIPSVYSLCGKRINDILKEKKIVTEMPEDMTALFKKYASIRKHVETNKHDRTADRGLHLTESKIGRLAKYYKRTGRIPEAWKFEADRMGFFAE